MPKEDVPLSEESQPTGGDHDSGSDTTDFGEQPSGPIHESVEPDSTKSTDPVPLDSFPIPDDKGNDDA